MSVQTLVIRRSEDELCRWIRSAGSWKDAAAIARREPTIPYAERLIEDDRSATQRDGDQVSLRHRVRHSLSPSRQTEKLGASLREPIGRVSRVEMELLPQASVLIQTRGRTRSAGSVPTSRPSGRRASRCNEAWPRSLASRRCSSRCLRRTHSLEADHASGLERAHLRSTSLSGSFSSAYERSSRATQEQWGAEASTSLKDALGTLKREDGTRAAPSVSQYPPKSYSTRRTEASARIVLDIDPGGLSAKAAGDRIGHPSTVNTRIRGPPMWEGSVRDSSLGEAVSSRSELRQLGRRFVRRRSW